MSKGLIFAFPTKLGFNRAGAICSHTLLKDTKCKQMEKCISVVEQENSGSSRYQFFPKLIVKCDTIPIKTPPFPCTSRANELFKIHSEK